MRRATTSLVVSESRMVRAASPRFAPGLDPSPLEPVRRTRSAMESSRDVYSLLSLEPSALHDSQRDARSRVRGGSRAALDYAPPPQTWRPELLPDCGEFTKSTSDRITDCASAAWPATRNGSALGTPHRSGPRPLRARVMRRAWRVSFVAGPLMFTPPRRASLTVCASRPVDRCDSERDGQPSACGLALVP
jgi:hypothetical protein